MAKIHEQMAQALADSRPEESHPVFVALNVQWRCDCAAIAKAFAADNPKFDRVRFLRACGDEEGARAWARP